MMDFARRLEPAVVGDTSRAVAVLPARFGGAGPLRDDAVGWPQEAAAALAMSPQAVDRSSAARAAMQAHEPRDAAQQSRQPMRDADLACTYPGAADHAAAMFRSRVGAVSMLDPRMASSASERATGHHAAYSEAAENAVGSSAASPAVASPSTSARQPLSDAALAARNAQPAPAPRPIVHVTIDRIEVRAPAAPSKPTPAAAQRACAPSVSLGDYLRQRTPQRGGSR